MDRASPASSTRSPERLGLEDNGDHEHEVELTVSDVVSAAARQISPVEPVAQVQRHSAVAIDGESPSITKPYAVQFQLP